MGCIGMAKKHKRRKKNNECRWTNKRYDGTYVTRGGKAKVGWAFWRNLYCPNCGRLYRYFRMGIDRTDIFESLKREANEGELKGLTIRTVLGKSHEIKQAAWQAHITLCKSEDLYLLGKLSDAEMEERFRGAYSEGALPGYFVDKARGPREGYSTPHDLSRVKDKDRLAVLLKHAKILKRIERFRKKQEKEEIPF
jgi:hypothetical protein